jgi:tellurite resistance protein
LISLKSRGVKVSEERLRYFPIMMFAIVMGFSGITIVFQKAAEEFGFSALLAQIFVAADTILFGVIAFLYLAKIVKFFEEVKKEFAHPVRINFFAAVSISMILISIIYHPIAPMFSEVFCIVGTVLHTFLTFYTFSFWINNNMEITHSNPAWFIPIVGNVLIPIAGSFFLPKEVLIFYFSVGIFFWIILLSIILNRIIFHHQMAVKFMPTLFILIAPPAIGVISYVKIVGEIDFFVHFMYSVALFFTFLLLFMYKNFLNLKFFISWWAFVFPIAAMTISSILMYKKTHAYSYELLSFFLMGAAVCVISIVIYQTFIHIGKKEICIQE